MKTLLSAVALAATVCVAPLAAAAPIALFNTGVDAGGNVLADGTIGDPHYALIATPGGTSDIRVRSSAGGYPVPPYIGDDALSRWIGPNNDPQVDGPVGNYTYRTTFDLTGYDPTTASISGLWSSDNDGVDILINGTGLGYATSVTQFSDGWAAFSVGSGFVAGINTLDFVVHNGGGPTAVRVEMTGSAAGTVPEPATLALTAAALLGLGLGRRRAR